MIPTRNDKLSAKILAAVVIVIVFSLILRYINGYTTFWEGFGYGFLLWSVVKQSLIGEGIALVVCAAVGLVIHFLL